MTLKSDQLRQRVEFDLADSLDEEYEMELDDDRLDKLLSETADHRSDSGMDRRVYFRELFRLQGELVRRQDWVAHHKKKIVVVFEGRDSAGGLLRQPAHRAGAPVGHSLIDMGPLAGATASLTFSAAVSHVTFVPTKQGMQGTEHVNIIASLITALAVTLGWAAGVQAQTFPSKPITLMVGFAPGGPTDTVARIIADPMKTTLGQTVVVENVGGAAGTIAAARVARATPDGHTLNVGQWTSNVGGPAITPTSYDVLNDFEAVSLLTTSYLWIVGRKSLPANNLQELIAWLKANPDKSTGAIVGSGSAAHVCFLDFQNKTGTKFALVPYKGGTPALQDLVGGQVDISCLEAAQTMQQFRAGMVKVFGVLANKRWAGAPDVPTLAEGGLPGHQIEFWHGLWAPKGTPKDVVGKLNGAVSAAFADPAVRKRFADLGHAIPPPEQQSPQALFAHHKAEVERWWPLIKAAGIKAE